MPGASMWILQSFVISQGQEIKRQKLCQNTIGEILMKINRLLWIPSLLTERRKRLMKSMFEIEAAKDHQRKSWTLLTALPRNMRWQAQRRVWYPSQTFATQSYNHSNSITTDMEILYLWRTNNTLGGPFNSFYWIDITWIKFIFIIIKVEFYINNEQVSP